ncbi:MAG TPA: long-chain fatty acid--CoA ligase [Bacteroidales bacterium]|nr:long-chain fatty acid--CoA ligase [Bacteroidales bacterium]HPO65994.1 long-chain fatty acid--CoA ligase [Bacteroidales bacterium]
MEPLRLFDLVEYAHQHYSFKEDLLAGKYQGSWKKFNSSDFVRYTQQLSCAFLSLGFQKGDRIVTIINNRPEWLMLDMAIMQAGLIHVPVYPTISKDDYKFILEHCEPVAIIVSDRSIYEKIKSFLPQTTVRQVIALAPINHTLSWDELLKMGKDHENDYVAILKSLKDSIQPHDVATIIYTSGTTGDPKGVMLTHNNLLSNVIATSKVHQLTSNNRALSFLPLSHVYERMLNYHYLYKGISIYYAENMGTIAENLQEVKPHIFCAVPRIFELFFEKIQAKGHDLPIPLRWIFFHAVRQGLKYDIDKKYNFFQRLHYKLLNLLVYRKVRDSLGGNLHIVVSGGASLQPRLARLFWAAGVQLLEGYGLSETLPVIAVNQLVPTRRVKIGTVGPIIEGVEVKLGTDSEILCKGPNVMKGYYKADHLTAQVIDEEGWFHTGDIGVFVEGQYLKITDRKKEIFKLSSGKYVAPQPIENLLKESEYIEQAIVIGENEKFASALILPNFYYLHSWCAFHKIHFQDNEDLIKLPQIQSLYQQVVAEVNKQLGQTEQIKRIRLLSTPWSYETGELSPTLNHNPA